MNMNPVGWFEVPVTDMARAVKFYQEVFGYELKLQDMGGVEMAWFPWDDKLPGCAGTLIKADMYKPSNKEGVMIYFSSPSGDLANELARVEAAGGKVIKEKTSLGEYGHFAIIHDTEGNSVSLHSMN